MDQSSIWPELSIVKWKDTCATVHMWTQVIGKIRTVQMPWINHSWHTTLYVTPRGLTTLAIPHGQRTFQIEFDFADHQLAVTSSDEDSRVIKLEAMSVADFYGQVMSSLEELNLPVEIHARPNEVDPAVPFERDFEHASYNAQYVGRFRRALVQTDRVMKQFEPDSEASAAQFTFFGEALTWP